MIPEQDRIAFLEALTAAGIENPESYLQDSRMLATLPNEILRTLPRSITGQMDLGRLGTMSNEDLLERFRDLIPKMANDRLESFGQNDLSGVLTDPNRRIAVGLDPFQNPDNSPARTGVQSGVLGPGYGLSPGAKRGTLQDIISTFSGIDLPNELDVDRIFNFTEDPENASLNLLQAAGINPSTGNPLTGALSREIPRYAEIARIQDILGGGRGDNANIVSQAPRLLGGGINRSSGEALIPQIADLHRRYASGAQGLTDSQSAFAKSYLDDPSKALGLIGGLKNVSPDLRSGQKQANRDALRRYNNNPGGVNRSIFDFLGL